MELADRVRRYRKIEEYRERPLITYATSTRIGVPGNMAADAVREFIDQIDSVEGDRVDVLLHSTGGDALTAWKLMSLLRERFNEVSVLVPYMAFSAATIFALGADEIVMHPHASLGPIDPQIAIPLPDGSLRGFSYEDVGAFLRFLSEEVGVTEQVHVSGIVDKLFSVVDPLHVGGAKRASELSTDVGERLLRLHMTGPEDKTRAREIAANLNKTFFAHGDAVSRSRAKELSLKVAEDDHELSDALWDAFRGIESYMELRQPFNPMQYVLRSSEVAEQLRPAGPLRLPANTEPSLAQQAWQVALNNAIQKIETAPLQVDFSLVNAIIESPRVASEFRTSGHLIVRGMVGSNLELSKVDVESGWRAVDLAADAHQEEGA